MSAFKDMIAADVHAVFLNTEEFSDLHNINGKDMPVQEDSNEQIEHGWDLPESEADLCRIC